MKLIRLFWVGMLALLVTACGGGGSGGSGSSQSSAATNNFSLRLSANTISAKCYVSDSCSVDIRADYQGLPPSEGVYVIATLGDKVEFSYSLYNTYANLHFSPPAGTRKGIYKGDIAIDVCGDQACKKRYGTRYTLTYEWTMMISSPVFSYGVVGSDKREVSFSEINLSGIWGADPSTYELVVAMPGEATEVHFPQEFIDLYHLVPVDANTFHLTPHNYDSGPEIYTLNFTGPNNYSRSENITLDHKLSVSGASPLPEQVVYASFSDADAGEAKSVLVGNYAHSLCGEASLNISLAMLTGAAWLSSDEHSCYLQVLMGPAKNNYGIYQGTITTSANGIEPQILPVIMAYSKNLPEVNAQGFTVYPDTTPEALQAARWFSVRNVEESFVVSAVSPWLSNVQLGYGGSGTQTYNYTIDPNELRKINPLNSIGAWKGVVKIDNTNPNGDFGLVLIDVDISIPWIFSIETKTSAANTVFTEQIHGASLFNFKGVEIVGLGLDANGEYTQELSRTFYYPNYEADYRKNTLIFDMPALSAGMYKLNFSGIFSHYFPDFKLEVK